MKKRIYYVHPVNSKIILNSKSTTCQQRASFSHHRAEIVIVQAVAYLLLFFQKKITACLHDLIVTFQFGAHLTASNAH